MATRFYLPSSGAAPVSPAYDGGWEDTSIAARLKTSPTKIASALIDVSFGDSNSNAKDVLFRQYVSDPIDAQTISAQALKFQIRGRESELNDNMFTAIGMRVVSFDGSTVRGTLLAVTRDNLELNETNFTNRQFTATTSEVVAQRNDRIVIEVGCGGAPLHSGSIPRLRIGDESGSDLPEDNTSTSDFNPWVEFANTLTFTTPYQQSVSGSVSPTGGLTRVSLKTLAGSLTPAGSLVKLATRALTGVLSAAAEMVGSRVQFAELAGALTLDAVLARVGQYARSLGGTVDFQEYALSLNGVDEYAYKDSPVGLDMNGAELLTSENSGFEGGTVGDWVGYGVPPTISSSTDQAHSGSRSLKIVTVANGNGAVYNAFAPNFPATVQGKKYTFEAWVYIPAAVTGTSIVLTYRKKNNSEETFALDISSGQNRDAWKKLVLNVTEVAGTDDNRRLRIQCNSGSGTFYVDLFSFTERTIVQQTILSRFRFTNDGATAIISAVSKFDGSTPGYGIYHSLSTPSKFRYSIISSVGNSLNVNSSNDVDDGQLHLGAVVVDFLAGTVKVIIDGIERGSGNLSGIGKVVPSVGSTRLTVGDRSQGNFPWTDLIGRTVYINHSAIPTGDILAFFSSGIPTKANIESIYAGAEVVADYDWRGDTDGEMLADKSGNGNDLTGVNVTLADRVYVSGGLTKQTWKQLAGALSPSALLAKLTQRAFTGGLGSGGELRMQAQKTLTGVLNLIGDLFTPITELARKLSARLAVYFRKAGNDRVEVTEHLYHPGDDQGGDSGIVVDAQLERRAFQRTVEDVRLKLSNLSGFFTDFFTGVKGTDRIEVTVQKAETLYRGEIHNKSAEFDQKEEWLELNSYSKTKAFWDIARRTRVLRAVQPGVANESSPFILLQQLLAQEISHERFPDIFTTHNIDALYANRLIRYWGDMPEPVGSRGRYRDLKPDTTVEQLLKAMAMYYNAEFFIDPVSGQFTMARRNAILRETRHQIDDVLLDDVAPRVQPFNDDRVDYIGLNLATTEPARPLPKTFVEIGAGSNSMSSGLYRWLTTNVYQAGSLVLESGPSEPTDPIRLARVGNEEYAMDMELPAVVGPVVRRNVYRTNATGEGEYYFAGSAEGKARVEHFIDRQSNEALGHAAPAVRKSAMTWLRYEETSGVWEEPIYDDVQGNNKPDGEVFEVTPQLTFMEPPADDIIKIIGAVVVQIDGVDRTQVRTEVPHRLLVGSVVDISSFVSNISVITRTVVKIIDTFTYAVDGPTFTITGSGVMKRSGGAAADTGVDLPYSILDVFAFFGGELDLPTFQTQFREMFLTKRLVVVSVREIEYRIGDSADWFKKRMPKTIPMGTRFVVKRARPNITRETTELELLTV